MHIGFPARSHYFVTMRNRIILLFCVCYLLLAGLSLAGSQKRPGKHRLTRTKAVSHKAKSKKSARHTKQVSHPARPAPRKPELPVLTASLNRSLMYLEPEFDHNHLNTSVVDVLALPDSMARHWVDSVFHTMTPAQKVGQFFMVATFSNRHDNHYQYIEHLIQNYHIGGVIYFQGGPYRQAVLTNRYQALAKIPLFVGIDGEWGLGMRLDSTMDFPKQMALGAVRNDDLIYRMGDEIGRQCKRLGIHINFAPVSDVNSNAANPVIGNRSFGEDKNNVARKAVAYMNGLQHNRIIATAKHFPGHGDASSDSHHTLPLINRTSEQLHNIDLYPFRQLIADSLMGVVTGHLHVPGIDNSTPAIAATLSGKVVTDLLKRELGFRGLVFTDAMNMAGVSRSAKTTDVNLRALMAGNDILLYPENVKQAITNILTALEKGIISQEFIDEKVQKILRAKYWAGLHHTKPIDLLNLDADLHSPDAQALKQELCTEAVTLVENRNKTLPLRDLDTLRLASVAIGAEWGNPFQKTLSQYAPFQHILYSEKPTDETDLNDMISQVGEANVVVVSLHRMSESASRKFGITKTTLDFISRLKASGKRVIVAAFGPAYSLTQFAEADAILCGYQDFDEMQRAMAQAVFVGSGVDGVMPVSVGDHSAGQSLTMISGDRLGNATPESEGMSSETLAQIDKIVQKALTDRVVPGCQVLVARRGKIVYDKNFGKLTYAGTDKVTSETLYDLASLTKVLSTLQCVMWLYDHKQIDLDQRASVYLPELRGTNKQNITLRDVLWHQSGMVSYFPGSWERTKTLGGGLKAEYYSSKPDSLHPLQVGPALWATPALKDSVWKWVIQSPMSAKIQDGKPSYVYSDLNFMTLQKVVERVTKQPMDRFVVETIYKPLGLQTLSFTPLQRLLNARCAPTEQDTYFRNGLLAGTVHDQMAAVQGGVSGHAGLFGNAHEIATLLQLNLQKGEYGGKRIFQEKTVPYFTQTISPRSHRALGWDKPNPDQSSVYVADAASGHSFGHTGFTGNVVWVDPDKDLVFVFLSNRIHPTAANNLINTTKLRKRIDEVIYNSIGK